MRMFVAFRSLLSTLTLQYITLWLKVFLLYLFSVRLGIAVAVAFIALKLWAATRKTSTTVSERAGGAYHSLATVGVNLGVVYVCYQLQTILARHSSRISEAESINCKLQETKVLYS